MQQLTTTTRAPLRIPKTFTPITITRLSLQNQVLRKLRSWGVRVLSIAHDSHLTIQIDQVSAVRLLTRPEGQVWPGMSAVITRRSSALRRDTIAFVVDGVDVVFTEQWQ
ncbi:hypothetical protein [Chitiniphilus shinanonensis]|uniref:hypothetical protein n=1 Tax=Chitiniphilus shinanonensis TaxID=553088 RepID=UPI0030660BE8